MRLVATFLALIPIMGGIFFLFVGGMKFNAGKMSGLLHAALGIIFILSGVILVAVDVAVISAGRMNKGYVNEHTYEPPQPTELSLPNIVST